MSYWIAPDVLITTNRNEDIDKDSIILKVCNYYGISLDELMSKSRLRKIADARNTLYYIFHKCYQMTSTEVAKMFNSKIKFLSKRPGERYASELTNMNLSNKVHKRFGKIKLKDLRNGAMIHFTGPSSGAKGETWKKQGNTMICLYGDGVKGKKLSISDMQNKLKSYGRIQLNAGKELTEAEKIDWERAYKSLFYRDALFGLSKKEKKLLLKIGQKLEKEKSKLKESTSKWKETLKKLASKDVLNKLSKSDKEKLFRIAQMLKKEEHPHDLPPDDKALNEKAPPGMEDVVLKLKKRKDVKNPYAVAWAMYNKKKGK